LTTADENSELLGRQRVTNLKLPDRDLLKNADQLLLYRYDIKQLFNTNYRHVDRFYYESRFLRMLNNITRTLSSGQILDLGCAQGNFSVSLAGKGYQMVGLDLRRFFIQYAKLRVEEEESENLTFVVSSAEYLPIDSESFDGVILGELLEHTSKPKRMICEAKRVLKPGGYLFISTPNGERLTPNKRRTYRDLKRIKRNWKNIEFEPDTHVFEFLKDELEHLILVSNLELLSSSYMSLAKIAASILCPVPISIRFLRKIEDWLVGIPVIRRKIAGVIVCTCRKLET
jgi:2-polyprenyl-3-methyl-5-hydroxy-6-metoxy-1,4-benzoquinol methylase